MKQGNPLADVFVRPEDIAGAQDLKALVTLSQNGSADSGVEEEEVVGAAAAEVHTDAALATLWSANGHRPRFKVKRRKNGEILLKGEGWVKVILPAPKVLQSSGADRGDGGWSMREHDRPTHPAALPARPPRIFWWVKPGPKEVFRAKLIELRKKISELETAAAKADPTAGASLEGAIAKLRLEVENLETREEWRRRTARRLSARKRQPKFERRKVKKSSGSGPKVEAGDGEGGKKGKKKKGGKKGGENKGGGKKGRPDKKK